MATYKKLSEYEINTAPNDGDLIPTLVDNGDGTYENTLMEYSSLKGTPGADGTNGVGVPTGGTTGQVLQKVSGASFDTAWVSMTLNKAAVGLANVDNTSDLDKPVSTAVQAAITAAIAQAKQESYPIGSMYFNADDATNPSTLLGFGTWVAYAQGQVPVGKATSGTFSTAGNTGGAETHTLSMSQIPNATGAITMHSTTSSTNVGGVNGVFSSGHTNGAYRDGGGGGSGPTSVGIINFSLGGGGQAHNNLQPYVVVYIWRRTA